MIGCKIEPNMQGTHVGLLHRVIAYTLFNPDYNNLFILPTFIQNN